MSQSADIDLLKQRSALGNDAARSASMCRRLLRSIDLTNQIVRDEFHRCTINMMKQNDGSADLLELCAEADRYIVKTLNRFDEESFDILTEEDYNKAFNAYNDMRRAVVYGSRALHFVRNRLSNEDETLLELSLEERLTKLEQFAIANSGAGVAKFARLMLPELESSRTTRSEQQTLPSEAPEIYSGLRGPETPPEFVARVYGPWLGKGLDRAHIKRLDPKLYMAINNWLSRPSNEWPKDVDLPTRSVKNERLVASGEGAIREHLGQFTGAEAARESDRIRSAARFRNNK